MKTPSIAKPFFTYVSFNVLGMIGLSCYLLADTFFVANGVGADGLAAMNLAIPMYSFMHGIGLMIGIGGATKFSMYTAQGDVKKANGIFTHSFVFTLIIGVLFLLIGIFASNPISRLFGADDATLQFTETYMKTLLCFAPLFVLNNMFLAFIRNDGAPKLCMLAMVLGSFANIILDYIFIFPLEMGMFGAALATGTAPLISLLTLSTHIIRKKNSFHLQRIRLRIRKLIKICSLGFSSLVTEVSSGIVLILFNILILRLVGNIGVAAYGVIANLSLVVLSVFTGIAQGVQPLASRSYALGKGSELKQMTKYSIIICLVFAIIVYFIGFFLSDQLVALFNRDDDPVMAQLATFGIPIYFIGFFFAGINIVSASILSASGKAKTAFTISIIRGIAAIIPLAFLLSALFGMTGVWLTFPCAEAITIIVTFVFLCIFFKKMPKDKNLLHQ